MYTPNPVLMNDIVLIFSDVIPDIKYIKWAINLILAQLCFRNILNVAGRLLTLNSEFSSIGNKPRFLMVILGLAV